jgi:hypothetical protein
MLALAVCGFALFLMTRQSVRARRAIGVAIVVEALICYVVPMLSLPRSGMLDQRLVTFLQANIGFARLYSLDRFAPNYGTYYRLPMINFEEPMVSPAWANEYTTRLDPYAESPFYFLQQRIGASTGKPAREDVLATNPTAFADLGLRYVIDRPGRMERAFASRRERPRVVYHDDVASIYLMPAAKPYAEAADCRLSFASRDDVVANCSERSRLIRRELFYPGWSALVNDSPSQLRSYAAIFQQVALPRGHSVVRFRFAPAHERFVFTLWAVALLLVAAGSMLAVREQVRR